LRLDVIVAVAAPTLRQIVLDVARLTRRRGERRDRALRQQRAAEG